MEGKEGHGLGSALLTVDFWIERLSIVGLIHLRAQDIWLYTAGHRTH